MNAQELRCWLLARVAAATGIPEDELDDDQAFSAYGLESPEAVTIAAELADVLAKPVDATALYAYPTIGTLADALAGRKSAPGTKPFSIAPAEGRSPGPQAIVGMACRAPGAHGPEAFWSMLLEGVDAVGEIPRDRWDPDQYWSPNRSEAGTTISKWAGLLDDIEGFDASFFGISPAEAERMDPQQRLLLETIWEALEDAGLPPADLRGSQTGVFVGISVSEYGQRQHMDAALIDGLMPTGSALSIAANRVRSPSPFPPTSPCDGPLFSSQTRRSSSTGTFWASPRMRTTRGACSRASPLGPTRCTRASRSPRTVRRGGLSSPTPRPSSPRSFSRAGRGGDRRIRSPRRRGRQSRRLRRAGASVGLRISHRGVLRQRRRAARVRAHRRASRARGAGRGRVNARFLRSDLSPRPDCMRVAPAGRGLYLTLPGAGSRPPVAHVEEAGQERSDHTPGAEVLALLSPAHRGRDEGR